MLHTNNPGQIQTQTQIHINSAFPRPKKAKTPVLNNRGALLKMDKPVSNNLSQLINNFLIHQQIPQMPNNLKHLFTGGYNDEIVSIASVGGKLVVIVFFKYPRFSPNIPGSKTETRKITCDVIANNPSYLCVFDFATCQVLDVVPVPGEIKYATTYRQFAAISYSAQFGSKQNHLISFAVSPISHKFAQIHTPIDIDNTGDNITKIGMNYISLEPETITTATTTNSGETRYDGRLIIYCCFSPKPNQDYLITFNHCPSSDNWNLHKTAVISGSMSVIITKYTQTDYFAAFTPNQSKDTARIIALHMDNPNPVHPVSEIYRQKLDAATLCTNDYVLHPDGRLELIKFDIGRVVLKSDKNIYSRGLILETISSQYTYPPNKGGIEIIYSTTLEKDRPVSQELAFSACKFTVKNGIQEYQLQPGHIMKYACMKYIHKQNTEYLYKQITQHRPAELKSRGQFIYSPDGKYLAQIIECNGNNFYNRMLGVLLYSKTRESITGGRINPGIWRECAFINSSASPITVNFIPKTNYDGQHTGYNLMITMGYQDKYKNYTIIYTPSVLADKYCAALSKTNIQLGQSNIRNISRFLAAAKLRYVDLPNNSNSSCIGRADYRIKTRYKDPSWKLNI